MAFHHTAKKSLGQNFLKSKSALSAIVDAGDIHADDIVLEIGPGKGALTERLLALAGKVVAVEKDRELVAYLQEKFKEEISNKKLELIEGDILEIFSGESFFQVLGSPHSARPDHVKNILPKKFKLLANIPYNITGEILRKFLSGDFQPERMVLLVQKEVADRIVARKNKESILSISVKAYGVPKYIEKVSKRFFSPEPKVDSAIIAIEQISKNQFHDVSEARFFSVVKAGFAHKRKLLKGNLKTVFPESDIEKAMENLSPNTRAEDISLSDWFAIAKAL